MHRGKRGSLIEPVARRRGPILGVGGAGRAGTDPGQGCSAAHHEALLRHDSEHYPHVQRSCRWGGVGV
jgi:hypothetical protein